MEERRKVYVEVRARHEIKRELFEKFLDEINAL